MFDTFNEGQTSYFRRLIENGWRNFRQFAEKYGLFVAGVIASTGVAIGVLFDWHTNAAFASTAWKAGALGAVGAPILVGMVVLLYFLSSAPRRLDEELRASLETEKQANTTALAAAGDRTAALERESSARYQELEQRHEELRESRPSLIALALCTRSGGLLVVPIQNDGAVATISASLSVTGDSVLIERVNAIATWRGSSAPEVVIRKGQIQEIVVASNRSWAPSPSTGNLEFYWWVPFIEDGVRKETRSRSSSWPLDEDPSRFQVEVKIFSEPEAISDPINFSLTLVGCNRWDDVQGIAWEPPQIDSPREVDFRQEFFVEAGECIVKFHEMRGGERAWEDLEILRQHAGKAHMYALRLEPDADCLEALRLVRPLTVIREDDFNNSEATINELQNFILRIR